MRLAVSVMALVLFTACPPEDIEDTFGKGDVTITAYLEAPDNVSRFGKFLEIMEVGGIKQTLTAFNKKGLGYTLFAPTDKAVDAFIARSKAYNSYDELIKDVDFVRAVCRYHVLLSPFERKDFGYGVMADTTATGDFLTLTYQNLFSEGFDSVLTLINGFSPISLFDVSCSNGVVHEIDVMLEPNVYTTYQWIKNQKGFDIFAKALEETGLKDTINSLYRLNEQGEIVKNTFTLLMEPDSVFHKRGIMSYEDLYKRFYTEGVAPSDKNSGLYQFVAYHISEKDYFLNDPDLSSTAVTDNETVTIVGSTLNTYSILPYTIVSDYYGIRVNRGSVAVDTIVIRNSRIPLSWVPIMLDQSNLATQNGSIHFISEILLLKDPGASNKYIGPGGFEPVFSQLWTTYGAKKIEYEQNFTDQSVFNDLNWTGVSSIEYKTGPKAGSSSFQDLIALDGFFTLNMVTPRIFKGKYNIEFRAEADESGTRNRRATVQVYIDGIPKGVPIDLNKTITTSNADKTNDRHRIGQVEFTDYTTHQITIKTLAQGYFAFYNLAFVVAN